MNPPDDKTERDVLYNCIFAYLSHCQEEIQTEPYYTTGSCVRHSDIQDCLARIDRLKLDSDSFVVHHLMTVHHFSQK